MKRPFFIILFLMPLFLLLGQSEPLSLNPTKTGHKIKWKVQENIRVDKGFQVIDRSKKDYRLVSDPITGLGKIEIYFDSKTRLSDISESANISLMAGGEMVFDLKGSFRRAIRNYKAPREVKPPKSSNALLEKLVFTIKKDEVLFSAKFHGEKMISLGKINRNGPLVLVISEELQKLLRSKKALIEALRNIVFVDAAELLRQRVRSVTFAHPLIDKNVLNTFRFREFNGLAIYQEDIVLGDLGGVLPDPPDHRKPIGLRGLRTKYCPDCDFPSPPLDISPTGNAQHALLTRAFRDNVAGKYLWWFGQVPYELDPSFTSTEVNRINQAIQRVNSQTNIRMFPWAGEEDYIYFESDPDLSIGGGRSNVGRVGGKQVVWLNQANTTVVTHELLHVFGAWHEQSRADRDDFIEIKIENIVSSSRHNFDIQDGYPHGSYDKSSIMHYSGCLFSKDTTPCSTSHPKPTIIDLSTGNPIGVNNVLSAGDIAGLASLYPDALSEIAPIPSVNTYRVVKLNVDAVRAIDTGDGVFGGRMDIFGRLNAGVGRGWARDETPQATFRRIGDNNSNPNVVNTGAIRNRDAIYPNWNVEIILQPGQRYVQFVMHFQDADGLFNPDDKLDTSPTDQDMGYLIIDTVEDEVWLADNNREMEDFLGEIGEREMLEGYDSNMAKVATEFRVSVNEISENAIEVIER